jgi:membrane-bound serine protease (ClpP class)
MMNAELCFQSLNVANDPMLGLIWLGIIFLAAESFVPSFGILGVIGLTSFMAGSFLFFGREGSPCALPWPVVALAGLALAAAVLAMGLLAAKTLKRKKQDADHDLKKKAAKIVSVGHDRRSGQVEVAGEIWKFNSEQEMAASDAVEVLGRQGLTLNVRKKE